MSKFLLFVRLVHCYFAQYYLRAPCIQTLLSLLNFSGQMICGADIPSITLLFYFVKYQVVISNHVTSLDNVAIETILPSAMV